MAEITEAIWRRRPDNLFRRRKNGIWYYTYRSPTTGKETGLGSDYGHARQAVVIANERRMKGPVEVLVARIDKPRKTLQDFVTWFKTEILEKKLSAAGKPLAKDTLYERGLMLATICRPPEDGGLGGASDVAGIDRLRIAEFLSRFPAQTSNRYRSLLKQIFRHMQAEGLRDDNPVELTIKKDFVVQRQRLPLSAFEAIRGAAAPWMQRTMDLAFWSLQRREDLVLLQDEAWKDGTLSVRQKKVEGYGTGLLRIRPGAHLKAAIIACLNSPERRGCPYLVHRVPDRRIDADWREHDLQVSGELVSKTFAEIRDQLGLFDALQPAQRPTWHEIRALGADHYQNELKWPEERVQRLLGHAKPETTKIYLGRHGERWIECEAA